MSDDDRIVWVIGAGFSKSLGGPLLSDFFSAPLRARIKATWPDLEDEFRSLHSLFSAEAVKNGAMPWRDAEEFSEILETAAIDAETPIVKSAQSLLAALGQSGPFGTLRDCCRRYLASACHFFMVDPALAAGQERWRPYVNWASSLEPTDTVITFNYDTVVETACKVSGWDLSVPLPHRQDPGARPRLLKLHGSVSWHEGPTKIRDDVPPDQLISSGNRVPIIATPGPSKTFGEGHRMRKLWDEASEAIKRARVVVFVGYRFPQSDVQSKQMILDALSQNRRTGLLVRLVLGPENNADVIRLTRLAQWAIRKRDREAEPIAVEPLWAEDFLAVVDRGYLTATDLR